MGVGLDAHHEARLAERHAQPLALTNRELLKPSVLAQHLAGSIDEFPSCVLFATIASDESRVVIVGDEADFLGVGLVGGLDARLPGHLSNRSLGISPHRKDHVFQDFAFNPEQDVRLVLIQIEAPKQARLILTDILRLGIVAAGYCVGSDRLGELPQLPKLQPDIAHHTRIRCPASQILVGEIVLDLAKRILKVQRVKRDIEGIGHPSGIGGVPGTAAPLMVRLERDNRQLTHFT